MILQRGSGFLLNPHISSMMRISYWILKERAVASHMLHHLSPRQAGRSLMVCSTQRIYNQFLCSLKVKRM